MPGSNESQYQFKMQTVCIRTCILIFCKLYAVDMHPHLFLQDVLQYYLSSYDPGFFEKATCSWRIEKVQNELEMQCARK